MVGPDRRKPSLHPRLGAHQSTHCTGTEKIVHVYRCPEEIVGPNRKSARCDGGIKFINVDRREMRRPAHDPQEVNSVAGVYKQGWIRGAPGLCVLCTRSGEQAGGQFEFGLGRKQDDPHTPIWK